MWWEYGGSFIQKGHVREVVMNDVDDAFAGILADDWLLAPATDFPAIQLLLDFLGRFTILPRNTA